MKRLLPFLLLFLAFALSACNNEGNDVSLDGIPIYSMYNIDTGETISFGMTKTAVEALLGEGAQIEPLPSDIKTNPEYTLVPRAHEDTPLSASYGSGKDHIVITYDDTDEVSGISCSALYSEADKDTSNWCLKHGIAYGNSREDFFSFFEEKNAMVPGVFDAVTEFPPFIAPENLYIYEYYFDADGNFAEVPNDCAYVMIIGLDNSNGKLLHVGIYSSD